ncbi:MAG: 3'(2'),5'-bisphosphate nucleotidase CysQ [Saprospiraceae bacterium]
MQQDIFGLPRTYCKDTTIFVSLCLTIGMIDISIQFGQEDINFLASLLRESGEMMMRIYVEDYSWDLHFKDDKSPVTKADTMSDDFIRKALAQRYPEFPIISEEGENEHFDIRSKYSTFWLLDPLDGTKEFIHKTGEFTINLALVHNNQPMIGFIYAPFTKMTYVGIRGNGSIKIDRYGLKTPMYASTFSMQDEGIRVLKSRHGIDEKTQVFISKLQNPVISTRGSALKFVAIAEGEADYYPRMINIMEWDTAAGQILIEEAGGKLIEAATGEPLKYNTPSMRIPYFIAMGRVINE